MSPPARSRVLVRSPTLLRALLLTLLAGCSAPRAVPSVVPVGGPGALRYIAARTPVPITVDGRIDEKAWAIAPWSEDFIDIEGSKRPTPRFRTRVRMLWDDKYWYVAAEMEETELWATVRIRDSVIFRDNDFELFIDPTGSSHRYYEVEINQFGTVWDLFLPKPYSEGGHAVNEWNIAGLRAAVSLDGTINHVGDRDRGWKVEMAIPWDAFADSGRNVVPPHDGDRWRVNFSRVEWQVDTTGGVYAKRRDRTGRALPEDNWVWSPQGVINMHVPAYWGMVQFGQKARP